ncbi:CARDB domain-containing protein [Nocardioides sp.]|uniref:CARDB domain-containing protein n=1 Tax=Nocardioides sp. TaxID=35761 RepID=UPI00286D6DBD|nr:CARDB domain-containing protein [Nocardioides sp.]
MTAVVGLLATGFTLSTADAAAPSQGTVSDADTSLTWGGGPFLVPNATGAAGTPDCSVPQSCDDFALHVATPAGYGTTHALNIKVAWANTAADFDVYVLDKGGNVVDTSASSADPEQVILPPNSGDYTVRVVPYAPLGESYSATATLTEVPANPAPGTQTPPNFATYAAPSTFKDANNAGEPSIGTNFKTGATLYQAYRSTFKATFDDSVSPARVTWSDVSAKAANGCPQGSTVSLDPILFTDHQTGRTFESQLSGANSLTCYTDDDGKTWSPSTGGGIPSGVDHQTIGGGPFASGGVGALPTSAYPDAVYYCSQDIATAFCAVSRDGGTTFGAGVPTYSLLDCGGLHGHIKVAPDGTAYLPNKGCGADQAVVVSKDNGTTWTVSKVPGATPGDSDPSVGVGSNGTTYFGYVGADGKPGVAVSRDQGKTWTDRQTVGTSFGIQNAVFPTVVAGDDDRASIAYLGTPAGGNYQDNANFHGIWHLYVDTTYDGGKTWVTSDATPGDPVQVGSICTSGTTCGDDRNLLDFMDVTVDDHGRITVGFADGCISACVTDPNHTGRDSYATIARQSAGNTLFAKYDQPTSNATLSSLAVAAGKGGSVTATMLVKNTGTTTLTDLGTQVLDGTRVVGALTTASLAPGASRTLGVTWKTTKGNHTVTATVDPADRVVESNEADNKLQKSVTVR